MTAVARIQPSMGLAMPTHEPTFHEPTFPELVNMGNDLVKTGFLPDHIKNGAQAAAIILTGRELGMPPMRALRSLALVKGKVTENADSQLARFKTDGGRAKFVTLDADRAVLWLKHPNGDEHTESFTMQDATKAGLTGAGGMYQKYGKAMLRSRVITAGLKSIGWEGGAGTYDPDELAPTPAAPAVAEIEDAQVEDAITDAQHDLLSNLLKSHVFTDSERARVVKKAATKAKAGDAIEWAQSTIKTRKDAEKEADLTDATDAAPRDQSAP